jgi:hypothetical protein
VNRSKAKGTWFESSTADFLRTHGFPWAHRNPPAGSKDVGDIGGVIDIAIQCKNCVRLELSKWMDEAAAQAANADASLFCVVHKRKGKGDPGEQFVTMPLWVFAILAR